jgi:hypothetical protein
MTDKHTRKDALQELLAKVEAGEVIQSTDAVDIWPIDARSMSLTWLDACKASQGSLDAALALHNAVLPGWIWSKDYNGEIEVWKYGLVNSKWGRSNNPNPARALLIAILRALIAECDT